MEELDSNFPNRQNKQIIDTKINNCCSNCFSTKLTLHLIQFKQKELINKLTHLQSRVVLAEPNSLPHNNISISSSLAEV